MNTYKVVIPYSESASPLKQFKIEYTIEASDRDLALKKAEKEFYGYTQYASASWVRTIDRPNVRAWRILPEFPQTIQSIDELAKDLESLDQDTLYNVLKSLGEIEDATYSAKIIPLLNHASEDLAALAAEALGKMGNHDSLQPLLAKFRPEAPPRLKACILSSLARLATASDPIEDVVAAALNDADSRVRANAVELVEKLKLSGVARNLVPMLTDEDNRVRANVLKALWHSHDRTALVKSLKEMIGSTNRWMKISAAFVLQHIDMEERFELLDRLLQDQDQDVQKSARKTLFGCNDLKCLPFWLSEATRQESQFEPLVEKLVSFGVSMVSALIEQERLHPERTALIKRIAEKIGATLYEKQGAWAWFTFKGRLFMERLKSPPPKGYSLVELAVVCLIIAILVGGILPYYYSYVEESKYGRAKADMEELKLSILLFETKRDQLYTATTTQTLVRSGLMIRNSNDPWGHPYVIRPSAGAIFSAGTDGTMDTGDDLKVYYQGSLAAVSAYWLDVDQSTEVSAGDQVVISFTRPLKPALAPLPSADVLLTSGNHPDGGFISDAKRSQKYILTWSTPPGFKVGVDSIIIGANSIFVDNEGTPCKSRTLPIDAR